MSTDSHRRPCGRTVVITGAATILFAAGSSVCIAQSDWIARSTGPDVVMATNFSAAADRDRKYIHPDSNAENATFEQDQSASGGWSLRFRIPSNSGPDGAGSYGRNFSDDESLQFGAGEEFYVQWRQMFSQSMLGTMYEVTSGIGGWKQMIVGEGDGPGWEYGDAGGVSSCSDLEVVVNNNGRRNYPQMYHNCGFFLGLHEPFSSQYNDLDFLIQNAIYNARGTNDRERYVLWSQYREPATQLQPEFPGVAYHPDEWMSFQIRIAIGPLGTAFDDLSGQDASGYTRSTIEMWAARAGEASKKIIGRDGIVLRRRSGAGNPGQEKYGKVWLLPYHTGKDASQTHPAGYTWYDELIVSRSRIPDPASSDVPPVTGAAEPREPLR